MGLLKGVRRLKGVRGQKGVRLLCLFVPPQVRHPRQVYLVSGRSGPHGCAHGGFAGRRDRARPDHKLRNHRRPGRGPGFTGQRRRRVTPQLHGDRPGRPVLPENAVVHTFRAGGMTKREGFLRKRFFGQLRFGRFWASEAGSFNGSRRTLGALALFDALLLIPRSGGTVGSGRQATLRHTQGEPFGGLRAGGIGYTRPWVSGSRWSGQSHWMPTRVCRTICHFFLIQNHTGLRPTAEDGLERVAGQGQARVRCAPSRRRGLGGPDAWAHRTRPSTTTVYSRRLVVASSVIHRRRAAAIETLPHIAPVLILKPDRFQQALGHVHGARIRRSVTQPVHGPTESDGVYCCDTVYFCLGADNA